MTQSHGRRTFIKSTCVATLAMGVRSGGAEGGQAAAGVSRADSNLPLSSTQAIATNTYPWMTFAKRDQQEFQAHSDSLMKSISGAGITGYEPIISGVAEINGLQQKLDRHGLTMTSIYVNSVLHDPDEIQPSLNAVLSIAKAVRPLGTSIIVTNPRPMKWGGSEDKSDDQLKLQASALNRLGRLLGVCPRIRIALDIAVEMR